MGVAGHWHRVTTLGLVIRYSFSASPSCVSTPFLPLRPRCWMDTPRFVYRGTRFKPRNSRGLRQLARTEEPVQTIPRTERGILCRRSFHCNFSTSAAHSLKRLAVEQCRQFRAGEPLPPRLFSSEKIIFVKKYWWRKLIFDNLRFCPNFSPRFVVEDCFNRKIGMDRGRSSYRSLNRSIIGSKPVVVAALDYN